jgi:hypothetical protein
MKFTVRTLAFLVLVALAPHVLVGLAATPGPSVQVVDTSFTSRTPGMDVVEVRTRVDGSRRGDELTLAFESFAACKSEVPDRAERQTEVFPDTLPTRTFVHVFHVPRAARHEVGVSLIAAQG